MKYKMGLINDKLNSLFMIQDKEEFIKSLKQSEILEMILHEKCSQCLLKESIPNMYSWDLLNNKVKYYLLLQNPARPSKVQLELYNRLENLKMVFQQEVMLIKYLESCDRRLWEWMNEKHFFFFFQLFTKMSKCDIFIYTLTNFECFVKFMSSGVVHYGNIFFCPYLSREKKDYRFLNVKSCIQYQVNEIKRLDPEVIVTCGKQAEEIIFRHFKNKKVINLFHPSYVLRFNKEIEFNYQLKENF